MYAFPPWGNTGFQGSFLMGEENMDWQMTFSTKRAGLAETGLFCAVQT